MASSSPIVAWVPGSAWSCSGSGQHADSDAATGACSDQELVQTAQGWSITEQDLIGQVTCAEPYEWRDPTAAEWEFYPGAGGSNGIKPFHVRCGPWQQEIQQRAAPLLSPGTSPPAQAA